MDRMDKEYRCYMTNLDKFKEISQRVSLNIPDKTPWRWDREFNLALTVIERQDDVVIELPLTQEFPYKWDFSTIDDADQAVRDFFEAGFGLIPGQKLFTTDPIDGKVLYVAWWPWGDDARISLRMGLITISGPKMDNAEVKQLVCDWLSIKEE